MTKTKAKGENYKFFQHRECEYFPCHTTSKPEEFNCLFCYCPLYMLKDKCGGNFKYTRGVKDCSECLLPHQKKALDLVMSKIDTIIKIGSQRD